MAERKTGVFPLDYFDNQEGDFSDQEIVELLTKTIEYLKGGDVPSFSDRALKIRFMDHKSFFDENLEKFRKKQERFEQNKQKSNRNLIDIYQKSDRNLTEIGYENEYENENVYEYENTNTSKKNSRPKSSIKELVEGYSNNFHMVEDLYAFIEMRKKMKAPMTEQAVKIALNKLSSLTQDEEEAIKIIEQSIEHGWKSFYPLKEEKPKTRQEELHQLYEKYKKEEEESGQKRHDDPDEFSFSDIFQLESGEF